MRGPPPLVSVAALGITELVRIRAGIGSAAHKCWQGKMGGRLCRSIYAESPAVSSGVFRYLEQRSAHTAAMKGCCPGEATHPIEWEGLPVRNWRRSWLTVTWGSGSSTALIPPTTRSWSISPFVSAFVWGKAIGSYSHSAMECGVRTVWLKSHCLEPPGFQPKFLSMSI
jgi:hypothetical protein